MEGCHFPNKATPPGSTSYYCVRFSPGAYRDDLASVFLWKQELASLYALSDPGVARIKLQWWIEQVSEKRGRAEHPLTRRLSTLYKADSQAAGAFDKMAETTDHLLHRRSVATLDSYIDLCNQLGGGFARLLAICSRQALSVEADRIGAWVCHIEHLQLLGRLLRSNVNPLPLELLNTSGLAADQLLHSDKTPALLTRFHQTVAGTLSTGLVQPRRDTGCLMKLYRLRSQLIKLIENEHLAVIHQRISLTPIRKLWLAL